jgi:ABC-type glutathione transport system ATPase component
MSWVREYCNRAILIEKGRIILEGSPAAVVQLHQEHSEQRKAEAAAKGVLQLREPLPGARRRR